MTDPHFFGYGSLVNVRSHAYTPIARAVLPGWRRRWRATALRPAAFLTATPDPDTSIEGVIAPVPNGDWQALDLREAGYDRVPAPGVHHDLSGDTQIAVYAIPPAPDVADTCPILLSYLDVVLRGYHDLFGAEGVERFVETTDNWGVGIVDDRAAPLYPRAQDVGPEIRELVDGWRERLGVPDMPLSRTELARTG